ncbi:MAG: gluconate 2-dehydrogenase subunit 3 family protein [Acidobacteriota bacterium]
MSKKSFPVRATGGELRNLRQPGYYSGYSTLAQQKSWDAATRETVTERVDTVPPIRFFSAEEATILSAIVDRLIPQDDRAPDRTIPILPVIDERLHKNALNGFRYEDMPSDRDAYRLGIAAIDAMARQRFQQPFAELTVHQQELILKSLHDGEPNPPHPVWKQMPVHRFWALLLEDCLVAYYSHPWAWDEIGFGGPAYPRGYMRLEHGLPEPWEVDEQRYDWNPPLDSVSGFDEEGAPPAHGSLHGHGGTH